MPPRASVEGQAGIHGFSRSPRRTGSHREGDQGFGYSAGRQFQVQRLVVAGGYSQSLLALHAKLATTPSRGVSPGSGSLASRSHVSAAFRNSALACSVRGVPAHWRHSRACLSITARTHGTLSQPHSAPPVGLCYLPNLLAEQYRTPRSVLGPRALAPFRDCAGSPPSRQASQAAPPDRWRLVEMLAAKRLF